MGTFPYSGPTLMERLAEKHQTGSQAGLFRSGTFTLDWRAKVGSFPSPELEMLISAGEPCGPWRTVTVTERQRVNGQWQNFPKDSRPEDKRTIENNCKSDYKKLPLNGYLPGSSIRGIVRAWVSRHFAPGSQERQKMQELLGYQQGETIKGGKFEFLDAFPLKPTPLTLDIVNPQQDFQVFHDGQCKPLSAYTLGNGKEEISIKVAIRGIPGQATPDDVDLVWSWVTQALITQGVGSRTASGYGQLSTAANNVPQGLPSLPPGYACKVFNFTLLSQGSAGPNMRNTELRPTHWRGWLRSWLLRFFLGVMTPENARYTVGELLGTLEESSDGKQRLGTVSLNVKLDNGTAGTPSQNTGSLLFYQWQGQVEITAPELLLNQIILPIIRVAATVGGVGKGWRRPLHQFMMERRNQPKIPSARGSLLTLKHINSKKKKEPFRMGLDAKEWSQLYDDWKTSVENKWDERTKHFDPKDPKNNVNAEVFSPRTCAVYVVPGPEKDPLDTAHNQWSGGLTTTETRGKGMDLIYHPNYKKNRNVGGNAANGQGYCSWVTIQRRNTQQGQREIVCIFGGALHESRQFFLQDLQEIDGAIHIFGDF